MSHTMGKLICWLSGDGFSGIRKIAARTGETRDRPSRLFNTILKKNIGNDRVTMSGDFSEAEGCL